MSDDDPMLDDVRAITAGLPGVEERLSHGAPCFYVRRRPLCYYHDEGFSADGRPAIWCPAPPGVAEELTSAESHRCFRPTPSASGVFADWIGLWLDTEGATADATAMIEDAFRLIAPRRLIAELDAR